jgi:hypothetical protein
MDSYVFWKLTEAKYAETLVVELSDANFHVLVTSGLIGFSHFETSAPNSAKKVPTEGPAKTVEQSMTFKS